MKYYYKEPDGIIHIWELLYIVDGVAYLKDSEGCNIKGPESALGRELKEVIHIPRSAIKEPKRNQPSKDAGVNSRIKKSNGYKSSNNAGAKKKSKIKCTSSISAEESAKNAQKHIRNRANKMDGSIYSTKTPSIRDRYWKRRPRREW